MFQNIRRVFGLIEVNHRPLPEPENSVTPISCCYKCMEGIIGTESYKKDRKKKKKKKKKNEQQTEIKMWCFLICKKHQFKLEFLCESCFEG